MKKKLIKRAIKAVKKADTKEEVMSIWAKLVKCMGYKYNITHTPIKKFLKIKHKKLSELGELSPYIPNANFYKEEEQEEERNNIIYQQFQSSKEKLYREYIDLSVWHGDDPETRQAREEFAREYVKKITTPHVNPYLT